MMREKKKFGLACDLAVPCWGAIRLIANGKWIEAGVSATFSIILLSVAITAFKEGDWLLGAGAYIASSLVVNLASGCFVDKARVGNDELAN